MTETVDYLDLLWRVCRQKGWALLLTAQHMPASFATPALTELRHLDVIEPGIELTLPRRRSLQTGDLIGRVSIDPLEVDLNDSAGVLLEALYANELVDREAA